MPLCIIRGYPSAVHQYNAFLSTDNDGSRVLLFFTWVENLAIRSNDAILATLLTTPELYQIDPSQRTDPILIHTFPFALGLAGITEAEPDVFYIVAGNSTVPALTRVKGPCSI